MLPNPLAAHDTPPGAPLTQTSGSLPLPAEADLSFWKSEIQRSEAEDERQHAMWDENVEWYTGKSPDAAAAVTDNTQFVNVNVDFYQVEQKLAQLFYETPELQLTGKGALVGQDAILSAHRALLNELLGDDHADVLTSVLLAIKDCLCVSGTGPVLIGYQPTLSQVQPPPQPGSILGLNGPIQVPIHEQWYALHFSPKKFLKPADFHSTEWDRAPWLGMRFRMPLPVAQKEFRDAFLKQPEFKGTSSRDEHVLNERDHATEASTQNYVDGVVVWYYASQYDPTVLHPQLMRELVLIDGLEEVARHRDSPHQTIGPDGRMTANSLIGNPIHPLTIRSVPDASIVPSDAQMTRPLVRELCQFRTQMVQERDANRPRWGYDAEKLTPDTVARIVAGTLGDMIPLESGVLAQGMKTVIDTFTTGNSPRQTYLANDYIEKDIAKVLAIGPNQTSVSDSENRSATEVSVIDRAANVRLDAERRQVLRWYLKLVDKFSALVCRYMTPQVAVSYIGQQEAQTWGGWNKNATDGRMGFTAKPDSQIRLDAAQERRFALQLYQMTANDPNVVRVELLKNLFTKGGYDASRMVVDQLPSKTPEPNISFRFQGDDFVAPQASVVREILAAAGFQISQDAINQSASAMYQQVALGVRDASGKAVPPTPRLAEHGGPAEQVRGLSKQQGDETGRRPGAPTMEAA